MDIKNIKEGNIYLLDTNVSPFFLEKLYKEKGLAFVIEGYVFGRPNKQIVKAIRLTDEQEREYINSLKYIQEEW